MNDIYRDAFNGVGTASNPCILYFPKNFTPSPTSTGNGWFLWKGGYFKDADPEPYTEWDASTQTLTFHYDNQKPLRTNPVYDFPTLSTKLPGWAQVSAINSTAKRVVFDEAFSLCRPTLCQGLFYHMEALEEIVDLEYLNTSEVTSMWSMFDNCKKLKGLDLSTFNTANVTEMGGMFRNCSGLKWIDLSSFDTASVTEMGGMFHGCSRLTSLDLSNFNTSNVTGMDCMFSDCTRLLNLDLTHFDTANVSEMGAMFSGCSSLMSLDLSHFSTAKTSSFGGMFQGCSGLTSIDLSSFTFNGNWENEWGQAPEMFSGCTGLKSLIIPSTANLLGEHAFLDMNTEASPVVLVCPDGFTPQDATQYDGYFTWKGGYFKELPTEKEAYYALEYYDLEPDGVWMSCRFTFYYDNLSAFRGESRPVTQNGQPLDFSIGKSVMDAIHIHFDSSFADFRPTNTSHWFGQTFDQTDLNIVYFHDLQNLNTSEVTDMSHMFDGLTASGVFTEDVDNAEIRATFDTRKATNMDYMFANMSADSGFRLDLSSFTFNTGCSTEGMMKSDNFINRLTLPATANNLADNACSGVGSSEDPVELVCSGGFVPQGATQYSGYYTWKGGYFSGTIPVPEAYAVLDGPTLTFYYDTSKASRTGTAYDLNSGANAPEWYDHRTSVTSVVFDASFAEAQPTSCYQWFSGMTSLQSITGIEHLKTESVANMFNMFANCSSLTDLDVSGFSTENVTDMRNMFYGCSSLTSIDLSSFTFKSDVSTLKLLYNDSGLKSLTIPSTASNLKENACYGVGTEEAPCKLAYPTGLTLSPTSTGDGWFQWKGGYFKDVLKPYAVRDSVVLTFYYDDRMTLRPGTAYGLNTGTKVPGWNEYASHVETVVFDPSFAEARPKSCSQWFRDMSRLTTVTGIRNLNTGEVLYMDYMFSGCSALTSLDVSGFDTSNVGYMQYMFTNCSALTDLNVSRFDTSRVINMQHMFRGCSSLERLDLRGFTFGDAPSTAFNYLLSGCGGLKTLSIPSTADRLGTSACSGVGTQAAPCTLIYPDSFTPPSSSTSAYFIWKGGYFTHGPKGYAVLSGSTLTFYYDTRSGNRYGTVYSLNTTASSPEWSGSSTSVRRVVFDASFAEARPTSCFNWFMGMTGLTTIMGIENLRTDEVVFMQGMFSGCSALTSLDVSGFSTSKVTNMTRMFYGCSALTSLDVSGFSTSKVTYMTRMFYGCSSLESLDLSHFTFSSTTRSNNMLANCSGLETLTIPATAGLLGSDACTGVGSQAAPCKLAYPAGFTPEKTSTGSGWYIWKEGYFKDAGLLGDVNGDGAVTITDVSMTVGYVVGNTQAGFIKANADINGDQDINISDVMGIVQMVVN